MRRVSRLVVLSNYTLLSLYIVSVYTFAWLELKMPGQSVIFLRDLNRRNLSHEKDKYVSHTGIISWEISKGAVAPLHYVSSFD